MKKIVYSSEFFNVKDTLECGQIFRFKPYNKGYLVFSNDKACYVYNENNSAVIECEDIDEQYFINYFDLEKDYSVVYNTAIKQEDILRISANCGKGIRILNQDKRETLISFIISQNNNIPRIKLIIERVCALFGQKKKFLGQEFYTFPTVDSMKNKSIEIFSSLGLGYRANYIKKLCDDFALGFNLDEISQMPTAKARKELISIYGVGPKVADCVLFFGLRKSDSFPVDTWIEKIYRQDFCGKLNDRVKISQYFVNRFGLNAGYFQQYLFYYKRSIQKSEI